MSLENNENNDNYEGKNESEEDESTELMDSEKELIENKESLDEKSTPKGDKTENDSVGEDEISPEVRAEINEKSEYSSEINDYIRSVEELEIYQKAGLKETEIDGRKCLIRTDIDYDYFDETTQKTNRELMKGGRPPFDAKTGEKIELHHIGQDFESPLAELTSDSEHGGENHSVLHSKKTEGWRNDKEKNNTYNNVQRPNHWIARA